MQAAAVPVAKVAAMEAAAKAVEVEHQRVQEELEEKTLELAALKAQVTLSLRLTLHFKLHCVYTLTVSGLFPWGAFLVPEHTIHIGSDSMKA